MDFNFLKEKINERINDNDVDFIIKLYKFVLSKQYIPNEFKYKGYGRIYVKNKNDVDKAKQIIRNMSEYEYDYYFADDLISFFENDDGSIIKNIDSSYVGKFEIDLKEMIAKLWENNIDAFYCVE